MFCSSNIVGTATRVELVYIYKSPKYNYFIFTFTNEHFVWQDTHVTMLRVTF